MIRPVLCCRQTMDELIANTATSHQSSRYEQVIPKVVHIYRSLKIIFHTEGMLDLSWTGKWIDIQIGGKPQMYSLYTQRHCI